MKIYCNFQSQHFLILNFWNQKLKHTKLCEFVCSPILHEKDSDFKAISLAECIIQIMTTYFIQNSNESTQVSVWQLSTNEPVQWNVNDDVMWIKTNRFTFAMRICLFFWKSCQKYSVLVSITNNKWKDLKFKSNKSIQRVLINKPPGESSWIFVFISYRWEEKLLT